MKYLFGKSLKRFISILLTALLLFLDMQLISFADEKENTGDDLSSSVSENFEAYKKQYGSVDFDKADIVLNEDNVSYLTGSKGVCEGKRALTLKEGDTVEFSAEIAKEAKYGLEITYCTLKGRGTDMVISVSLDGSYPYEELKDITINRFWVNKTEITRDNNDNDICPEQTEVFHWSSIGLKSFTGYDDDNLFLVLHNGINKIRIKAENESIAISNLR